MELKCYINGVEYDSNLVQGCTFADEYNETLDSGTIRLCGVKQIKDLQPFDDVFIYEGTFSGYPRVEKGFYKHLLIDQFTETLINIDDRIYEYNIQLMSETKKLEVIQLPNKSITEPLKKAQKTSVFEYMQELVQLYSPLYKVATNGSKWAYNKKYTLDDSLMQTFSDTISPDFTLNAPSLKDVLTQLMLTKDMIPYVKDDVIYGMDITERKGAFKFDVNNISNVIGSMSSSNYADNLKRNYSSALSQQQSARRVEYLGFRNSDDALMTLDNMRLETQYPIYKINKVYMCYYKKGEVKKIGGASLVPPQYKVFLCKQDITPLVLLNSTRNLLSKDWNDFNLDETPQSIEELAQYKLCTIGYDIGGKYLTGWGTKYNYPQGWWTREKTYLENILERIDNLTPYGIYDYGYIAKVGGLAKDEIFVNAPLLNDRLVNPFKAKDKFNLSLSMKSFIFIIDYNAFYNGAVVHSKDEGRDDITINDNSSSSLTLLEKDGLFQKEKINRFGNKAIQINATYDNYNDIQPLGSVYGDDVVIYHKEIAINDNDINVVYYGTKDYVLKNYFVSVYAKHRTYNLMSYGESVNRAENKKMYIYLSKDKSYYEIQNQQLLFKNFKDNEYLNMLLSAFIPTKKARTLGYFETPNKINAGYITYDNKLYLTDVNAFVNGYSLCFNLKMFDNVSMGVYIKDYAPQNIFEDVKKDFTGSVQSWLLIADSETGRSNKLGFYVGHLDNNDYLYDKIISGTSELVEQQINEIVYPRLFSMPFVDKDNPLNAHDWKEPINEIGNEFTLYKDNKETIDMTFQFEPTTRDKDVLFSQWLMKLTDLLATYEKVDEDYTISGFQDGNYYDVIAQVKYISMGDNTKPNAMPLVILEMNKTDYDKVVKQKTNIKVLSSQISFSNIAQPILVNEVGAINSYRIKFNEIKDVIDDLITFNVSQELSITINTLGEQEINTSSTSIMLAKVEQFGVNTCPPDKVWFTNCYLTRTQFGDAISLNRNSVIKYIKDGETIKPRYSLYNFKTEKSISTSDNLAQAYTQEMDLAVGSIDEHYKNMFVVASTKKLNKTLVYDEYSKDVGVDVLPIIKDLLVQDTIKYTKDTNNMPYLNIDLRNIPQDSKSIQYWYLDKDSQSYKFVFGTNINENDIVNRSVKIYLSLLSTRDTRVYNDKHIVVGEINNYNDKTSVKPYGIDQYYK